MHDDTTPRDPITQGELRRPQDDAALHEPGHRGVDASPRNRGRARTQAEKILDRNRKLIEGDAEPGPQGEREVGAGRTVTNDSEQRGSGDYSND